MSQNSDKPQIDYKKSLFLPKTDFPMRAELPKKEPLILTKWDDQYTVSFDSHGTFIEEEFETFDDIYDEEEFLESPEIEILNQKIAQKEQSLKEQPKPQFTLHDGPPYANGHLHIGHALNKTLKDIVVRSKKMSGYDTTYVPGWDCHGLPIEWKIEEQYRKKNKNKDDVDINEFRDECRAYAHEWVDIQRDEFKRLGIHGLWENPYLTMDNHSESIIAQELLKFAKPDGGLYRSSKPVYWSCVEKTALADAETEYQDKESQAIWVKFPVLDPELPHLSVVIWTTTPWTIPANLAIAYNSKIGYGFYQVTAETPAENWLQKDEILILSDLQAENVFKTARIDINGYKRIKDACNLNQLQCSHPFKALGGAFTHNRHLINAEFVTDDAGTGLVHCAPGHGEDDYNLWLEYRDQFPDEFSVDLPHTIRGDGGYFDHIPKFWQQTQKYADKDNVYILKPNGKEGNANDAVIETLKNVHCLAGHARIKHSYPHSWRSKAPLIFRNTAQWFISMSDNNLRNKALSELDKVTFYPENGRNRITNMIKNRPDWVVSRQRAWGVPLALFVDKKTHQIINNDVINQTISDIFQKESSDAWWKRPATDFFPDFDPEKHEQITDILDVWFDSGTTHAFVLEQRQYLQSPADLYLEGSDQHRGWFHSSLLQSCGTRGHAPYKALLTHGFVLDEKGEKMSKSKGNVITPHDITKDYGADILRLWVATSDYHDDLRIGKEILKGTADTYRRLRNSMRWMLGALDAFDKSELIAPSKMPELEQWVLHRLSQIGADVKKYYDNYEFNRAFTSIFNFITNDLSSFYFDIRKDSLYCDDVTAINRRSCRTTLRILTKTIALWLAPIMPFTTDEIWTYLTNNNDVIHRYDFKYPNYHFSQSFDIINKARTIRRVVNRCLEDKRHNKIIGASLEAKPTIYISDKALFDDIKKINFADICIVGHLDLVNIAPEEHLDIFKIDDIDGIWVEFQHANGEKCQRCWKIIPEVSDNQNHLCNRCSDYIDNHIEKVA